jgi:hypothetical protein
MEYKNLVVDFITRTKMNLEFIENQVNQNDNGIFEVTQLINSMLGLLVFPCETYIKRIPPKSISELKREGWVIPKVKGNFTQARNLRALIKYLRNAIAHSNIEFISDGQALTGVRLWNCFNSQMTWCVEMTLVEMHDFVEHFTNLVLSNPYINKIKKNNCEGD